MAAMADNVNNINNNNNNDNDNDNKEFIKLNNGKLRILVSGDSSSGEKTFNKLLEKHLDRKSTTLEALGITNKCVDFRSRPLQKYDSGFRTSTLVLWNDNIKCISSVIVIVDGTMRRVLGYSEEKDKTRGEIKYTYMGTGPRGEGFTPKIPSILFEQLAAIQAETTKKQYNSPPVPVLIFVTRTNEKNAVPMDKLREILDINDGNRKAVDKKLFTKRALHIQPLDLSTGEGLIEGMDFLSKELKLPRPDPAVLQEKQAKKNEKPSVFKSFLNFVF